MKQLTKAKHFLVMLLAMSLMTACLPILNDEEKSSERTNGQTESPETPETPNGGQTTQAPETPEREVRRSPLPEGDTPAHRQNRRSDGPDMDLRSGDGPESEPCEAESFITSDGPALVFRNLNALQMHLPFSAALSALSTSNTGTGTPAEQEAIMQSMFDTFLDTQFVNSISNTTVDVGQRLQEAAMDPSVFIGQMVPLAAFNRLDLAANDGSVCGEQRITYALGSSVNNQVGNPISGQFTVIFEARYPNPFNDAVNTANGFSPSNTIADCLPVAKFWESIALMNNDNDRAIALAEFFFTGHEVTMDNGDLIFLPPVVTFSNYQSPMGQIRTNQFVGGPWDLREFRTDTTTGSVTLIPDTIKGNPVTQLYNSNSSFSQNNAALQQNFLTELSAQMDNLLAPEINGLTSPEQILTSFEPTFPEAFSGFSSISQGNVDNPAAQASNDVRTLIANEISARLGNTIPANSTVNEDQILNRLGAMTCGGCHQFSSGGSGVDITDTVSWPTIGATLNFVQVRDIGAPEAALSNGLIGTFLPLRRQFLLDTWLCDDTSTTGCVDDDDCDDGFICVAGECVEEPVSTGCQTNADCPYGEICVYNECVTPNGPTACDEPHADIVNSDTVQGNSTHGGSVFEGSCGGGGAEDVVVFTPEEDGTYCLDTKGSRGATSLHVRADRCESPRTEIGCATSVSVHQDHMYAQLELEFEVGQTYFIFVDSPRRGTPWQLNVNHGPCVDLEPEPEPEPENACEAPYTHQSHPRSIIGDSSESLSEFAGSCGGTGAEDVVVFTPDAGGLYCLDTGGSEIETALYVRAGFCDAEDTELGCAVSKKLRPDTRPTSREQSIGKAQLQLRLEAGDTYYVFVDGLIGNGGGSWILNIKAGPCRQPTVDSDDNSHDEAEEHDEREPHHELAPADDDVDSTDDRIPATERDPSIEVTPNQDDVDEEDESDNRIPGADRDPNRELTPSDEAPQAEEEDRTESEDDEATSDRSVRSSAAGR